MNRLHLYCRVSTDQQMDAMENQIEIATEHWRRILLTPRFLGFEAGRLWEERGVSAWSVPFLERPEGAKLLLDLRDGDGVLCNRLDRCFRSTLDWALTYQRFKKHHVLLVAADTPELDPSTPSGKLLCDMRASVAEYESNLKSRAIREGKGRLKALGFYTGHGATYRPGWELVACRRPDVRPGRCAGSAWGKLKTVRTYVPNHADFPRMQAVCWLRDVALIRSSRRRLLSGEAVQWAKSDRRLPDRRLMPLARQLADSLPLAGAQTAGWNRWRQPTWDRIAARLEEECGMRNAECGMETGEDGSEFPIPNSEFRIPNSPLRSWSHVHAAYAYAEWQRMQPLWDAHGKVEGLVSRSVREARPA